MRKPTAAEILVIAHTNRGHALHQKFTKAARGNDGVVKESGYPPANFTQKEPASRVNAQRHP